MHIREALRRILAPHPAHADIEPFVSIALHMAALYLHRRASSGSLHPAFFGLTVEDLTIDCVGPLFERDVRGRFPQLVTYYERLSWESLSDEELTAHTRRLVFSKVHQQLARLYKETDPSLEKILRNLRNAIRAHPQLNEDRRGGELWVQAAGETARQRHLPEMPWEYLEGHLIATLSGSIPLRQVVIHVAEILQDQRVYRKSFPLTTLALLVRTAFSRIGDTVAPEPPEQSARLQQGEIERAIAESVRAVSATKRATYVGKGKVRGDTYRAYGAAMAAILRGEFIENDGHPDAYVRYLAQELPGLTPKRYQRDHRCHLEYLVKLARNELLARMRDEL